MISSVSEMYARQPVALLQKLIQFDTTNPPGNERACIQFIQGLLTQAGIDSQLLGLTPERPNLVARLPGQGRSAPLLLYGHVDVVTTEDQAWTQPPFEGRLVDGYVWGRGALDMKGGVAMLLAAFLRAKLDGLELPGDVVLAVVSDEEAGGVFGARYLVEQHPEQFAGIRYALGEFGGFTLTIGGQRFYPIQVAEKQMCWMIAKAQGEGGHGSMPVRNGAMAKMARFLTKLDRKRLPVHITPAAQKMFGALRSHVDGLTGTILGQLTNPALTDPILNLLGERGKVFDPLLHHTASPTVLHGSQKINVIPCEVSVELDGRLLPGYQPEDLMGELRTLAGDEITFELLNYDPGPADPDMGLFDMLAEVLCENDPTGAPAPLLLSGVTDGRFFSKLGIQTYGFTPMQLPEDFNFSSVIHCADERIPAAALEFGTSAVYQALRRF
jgi:acetylornithine deacetylase/succinyl-diaminopimelate desuccinylase-like protein